MKKPNTETFQEQNYRLRQLAKASKPLNNKFVFIGGGKIKNVNLD